jgi:hypothetical protein
MHIRPPSVYAGLKELSHEIVLAEFFQKTGVFALYRLLAHAEFACDGQPVAYNVHRGAEGPHANCTCVTHQSHAT